MAAGGARAYARDPAGTLAAMRPFSGLKESTLARVASNVAWVELRAGQRLSMHRSLDDQESYYFVQSGQVAAVLDDAPRDHEDPPTSATLQQLKARWQYLSFFSAGDFFADGFAALRQGGNQVDLECIATVDTVLAAVSREQLTRVMKKLPRWSSKLREQNHALRADYLANRTPSRRLVQDFFLRNGYSFAETLKVIQIDRCIGCNGCEAACGTRHGAARLTRIGPTLGGLAFPSACRTCVDHRCVHACGFDAIAQADSGEVRVDAAKCVGCAACYTVCPNDVIEMREVPYTSADFPTPMPDTEPSGLTNVPGLYLAGEAAGAALIKLSINGGFEAVEHVVGTSERGDADVDDVVIVGAGPAGLSAALKCQDEGLRFTVFDKGSFATTIQSYPSKKMVMAEPAHIQKQGRLWMEDTTKEELLVKWEEVIAQNGLDIHSNETVTAVERGDDGVFAVGTSKGSYRARNVILAVGTRGSPRKLGVDGEVPERVKYVLTDPDEFANQSLLVVGGGDSAVEAAMSLADVSGTKVALSYRRDAFGRIKARNKSRIEEYAADGRVQLILSSTVSAIEPNRVVLKTSDSDKPLKNDTIFALLGAEPPTKFFESAGIRIVQPGTPEMDKLAASRGTRRHASKCDHCTGHEEQACLVACPTDAIVEIHPAELFVDTKQDAGERVFSDAPFTLGLDRLLGRRRRRWWHVGMAVAAVLVALATGVEVFLRTKAPELSGTARLAAALGSTTPLHSTPGKGLGLWLGIIGTTLMALTSLYPLQSRLYWFSRLARTRVWMTLHIWAGILGPLFVAYHTTLKLDRWPSIAFWLSWVVVLTGATGRYLSTAFKRSLSLSELEMQSLEKERQQLFEQWAGVDGRTRIFRAVARQTTTHRIPVLVAPVLMVWNQVANALRLAYVRFAALPAISDRSLRKATLLNFEESLKAARRRMFADSLTRSVTFWKRLHWSLTAVMFIVAAVHIVIGLLYKAT